MAGIMEQRSNNTAVFNVGLNWINPATQKNNGTLQSVGTTSNGFSFTQTFGYDPLNRLNSAQETAGVAATPGAQNWAQTFGYDPYGNMWQPTSSLYNSGGAMPVANVYNPQNNRNQNANSTYDAVGNQTIVNGIFLTYDANNRQVGASDLLGTGGAARYVYDGLGQRVSKVTPISSTATQTTVYVYDAFGLLAAEYTKLPVTPACTTCYLAGDHLGSLRLITDATANANVVSAHDYAPFGLEIQAGVGGRGALWGASDGVSQRFTGQERDTETGLDFFQARYLASGLGRFLSPDPGNAGADFVNPQSWNGYGYVLGNPLNSVDPSGMFAQKPPPPLPTSCAMLASYLAANGAAGGTLPYGCGGAGGAIQLNISQTGPGPQTGGGGGGGTSQPTTTAAPPNNGQTASKIGWCLVKGAAVGAAGAVVVGAAVVVAAPALGVSAAAASTALFLAGVAGGVTTGVSAYLNYRSGNYSAAAFDLGSLGGGLAVGGLTGAKVGDAINPPATRGFWSVTRDIQNIFSPSRGWNLGKFMATGPDAAAAAGATGAAGSSGSVLSRLLGCN